MESKVKIDSGDLAVASFLMIAAGIIGGLVAALFGLIDWIAVPAGTRAKRVGAWHGGGNVVVVALALGTAWAGGELVERLGVGVDEGAHLDAPSSLSGPVTGRAGARLDQTVEP